jgi:p-aminobenzoyl-glutamate transporter AbgT
MEGKSRGFLDWVERAGNRLPDPALHFLFALALVWVASAALSSVSFDVVDPRTGQPLTAGVVATLTCWLVIDRVVEPRLARIAVDADSADLPTEEELSASDRRSLFCARYVRGVAIGTIISLCLPIAASCFVAFCVQLALFWTLGIPMGLQAPYLYP